MVSNAFCVHGHFYQPSREDPLTGKVPQEMGAIPYKNWNERVFFHCYKPNTELNNFEKISFNFGPTLINWMAEDYPNEYQAIIQQDRNNYERYGVGNAMAQPYHHTILPLASTEDKITQIYWGIEDFKFHFGHLPSGMWLPETAVDQETLEVLAKFGIQFTILAPWQAAANDLDDTQPYWVNLSENRKIAVFFYNQELSTRVSFDPSSTTNADSFASNAVIPVFRKRANQKQSGMVLVASDGELYGHHQPYRDKFLSHLMNGSLTSRNVELTYPALWLQKHPPFKTMTIRNNTSWSCYHGVERWRSDCGCTPTGQWKLPLRVAIDRVSALIDSVYVKEIGKYTDDVWKLRHEYIQVLLGTESVAELIGRVLGNGLTTEQVKTIDLLLRAQLDRQRMFTSCGWFFEDFDRIEPRNVVSYAAQGVWWTYLATEIDFSPEVIPLMEKIESPRTGLKGSDVFVRQLHKAREVFHL